MPAAGDPRPEAPWESVLRNNIDGTQTLFETAVEAGVDKVAFASSNHAVGHYETERKPDIYRDHDEFLLDGTELPRPSNLYGVSKAAGETLGRYYHDEYGLSVVCVRIGNLTEGHPPRDYERGQAMWLSYRDCAHLFDRCLQAEYDFEFNASDLDTGNYTVLVTDNQSSVETESSSIEVSKAGEGRADIGGEGIVTDQRGDPGRPGPADGVHG